MTDVPPAILVVMGVSGSGKTTIAVALAERLGWPFQEGDALHPPANVAKMHSGQPLNDDDRWPWLAAVAAWIDARLEAGEPGIITCSALRRVYRDRIIGDRPGVRLVYCTAPREVLAARLGARQGHFMPASLLDSQLATLEEPAADERPLRADVQPPAEQVVDALVETLRRT